MKRKNCLAFTLAEGEQSLSRHPEPCLTKRTYELASCVSLSALCSGSIPVADCNSREVALTGQTNIDRFRNKFGMTKSRQAAFTLAEVLITLGIIGVVAAMTLPTLVHKIEQKILMSQFKKMYSNMNTALQAVVFQDNDGNPYPCYRNSKNQKEHDCTQLYNDLTKQLKLIKTEVVTYLPYKNVTEVIAAGGTVYGITDDTILNNMNKGYYKYYFSDGSVFYRSKIFAHVHSALIIADINGDKKPNRWGYDVYLLSIRKNPNGVMYIGDYFAYFVEKGGMSAEEIIKK